jgi:hypothetical protein
MNYQPTLFDNPDTIRHTLETSKVNIPLSNKIESNYSNDVKQKRIYQKTIIYQALCYHGKMTQRQIHLITKIDRCFIPDRLQKLMKVGKIFIAGKVYDNFTKKNVTVYGAVK